MQVLCGGCAVGVKVSENERVCRCAGVKVCAGVRFQCGWGQERVVFQCEIFHVSVWYVEAQCEQCKCDIFSQCDIFSMKASYFEV